MKTELVGLDELIAYAGKLEKLPQKVVTRAAKKGASISLQDAKAKAPYLTGDLEGGIVLKAEKTKTKGKKVYQTTLDKNKNDIFQKVTKGGKTAYYPSSQEFGFKTRGGGKVSGLHFLKESITSNSAAIEKTIVDNVIAEIDKIK